MKIVLDGVTGTVGSVLIKRFLENGHKVFCIIRGQSSRAAKERLRITLGYEHPNAIAIKGDITEEDCGVSFEDEIFLASKKPDMYIHSAASTKFDKSCYEETMRKNVDGTKNSLDLFKKIRSKDGAFHFISSFYAIGGGEKLLENRLFLARARNPYEYSKEKAEEIVLGSGIPFIISRLSIVVGDSTTGRINSFAGMYGFFIPFHVLAKRKRKKEDIWLVSLPLVVKRSLSSTLNIVPIDWISEMLFQVSISKKCLNKTLHLVNPNPPLVDWIIDTGFQILGIQGIQKEGSVNKKFDRLQRFVNPVIKLYWDYINYEAPFEFGNLPKLLGDKYQSVPPIRKELLEILFHYAIKNNFGREKKDFLIAA